jgi:hypothetical protein
MNRSELEFEIHRKIRRKETTYKRFWDEAIFRQIQRYKRALKILENISDKRLPEFEKGYDKWVKEKKK